MKRCVLLLLGCLGSMPAFAAETAPAVNPDPLQRFNRGVFRFNDTLDRYVAKPVAKGYRKVTPRVVRTGISNFFVNLRMPVVMVNDLLQGKPRAASMDAGRFLMNSTWGLAGFIDVGSRMHIPLNDEDFGQTLGRWGVGPGPYVVLPFLGPSTFRDGSGLLVDAAVNPRNHISDNGTSVALAAVDLLNTRATLLEVEDIVQGDRYLFIRDLFLQRRAFLVQDGRVESDPFLDDSEEEEEAAPEEGADAAAPATGEAGQAPADSTVKDEKGAADDASF